MLFCICNIFLYVIYIFCIINQPANGWASFCNWYTIFTRMKVLRNTRIVPIVYVTAPTIL